MEGQEVLLNDEQGLQRNWWQSRRPQKTAKMHQRTPITRVALGVLVQGEQREGSARPSLRGKRVVRTQGGFRLWSFVRLATFVSYPATAVVTPCRRWAVCITMGRRVSRYCLRWVSQKGKNSVFKVRIMITRRLQNKNSWILAPLGEGKFRTEQRLYFLFFCIVWTAFNHCFYDTKLYITVLLTKKKEPLIHFSYKKRRRTLGKTASTRVCLDGEERQHWPGPRTGPELAAE